jgi:hypothetical protein
MRIERGMIPDSCSRLFDDPCAIWDLLPMIHQVCKGKRREMNQGVKRLALLLGGLAAAWAFVMVIGQIFYNPGGFRHWTDWLFVIIFPIVCFLIPFGLVHAIAWVVRGFKQ